MDRSSEMTPQGRFRQKVAQVLTNMRGRGYHPKVYSALRTRSEQKSLVASGASQTMRSNHLPGKDGLSRAADIADAKHGWGATRDFWLTLGRFALTQGLGWGGLFGLPLALKIKLVRFLTTPSSKDKPWNPAGWTGKFGWDPAHIEVRPGWLDRIVLKLAGGS